MARDDTRASCPTSPEHTAHDGPCPCGYWYDCTLDLQDASYADEVELIDYPTMSCRLVEGHDGPHQLRLDKGDEGTVEWSTIL